MNNRLQLSTSIRYSEEEQMANVLKDAAKVAKAEEKKFQKFCKPHLKKGLTDYQLNLMYTHSENDRQDLVETVEEGLLNRDMRRQAAKPQKTRRSRMTKRELIDYMLMVKQMEATSDAVEKLKKK
jgi:hypothetical protein